MNKKQQLAEFVGIILGDGNIHKTLNRVTIVGSLEDKQYYVNNVLPLIKNLFNIDAKLKRRNDRNAFYIYFYSKEIIDFLTEEIGLVRGTKLNAHIPSFILKNKMLFSSCLRGLFDTDGCLKFSKQTRNKHYYPRIRFAFRRCPFSLEMKKMITNFGFSMSSWEDNRVNPMICYEISGKENLEKWMSVITPNNPVHVSKYLFWKKFGYYEPKSTLQARLDALNLNTTCFFKEIDLPR